MSNQLTHEQFQELLPSVCDAKTSADPDGWASENPLWGHCAVVSLVAQNLFGGELLRVSLLETPFADMGSHYFNKFSDGSTQDFTAPQFEGQYPEGLLTEERSRDYVLSNARTKDRYDLLASRVKQVLLRGQPQKELSSGMRATRRQAEEGKVDIETIKTSLGLRRGQVAEAVREYGEQRVAFFLRKLIQHKKAWCTKCGQVFPKEDMKFLLTDRVTYSTEYAGSFSRTRSVAHHEEQFHRACFVCYKKTLDQHGLPGLSAFRVEKREDGYYAHEFGGWIKRAELTYEFPEVSERLIEQFVEEWGIPPKIEFTSTWNNNPDQLTIH